MSRKKILGGSIALTLAGVFAVALLVAGSVAVTPTVADAGGCFAQTPQRAWGHASTCAGALTSLNNQAAALCDNCPFDGSCGAGPSVTNQTSCYYAGGKWNIDADISNHCRINIQTCNGGGPPGGP